MVPPAAGRKGEPVTTSSNALHNVARARLCDDDGICAPRVYPLGMAENALSNRRRQRVWNSRAQGGMPGERLSSVMLDIFYRGEGVASIVLFFRDSSLGDWSFWDFWGLVGFIACRGNLFVCDAKIWNSSYSFVIIQALSFLIST